MNLYRFGVAAVFVALLGGCVSREEPIVTSEPAPVMRTRVVRNAPPPDRGDLDLGLPPAREGGPAYVRSGVSSAPRQGELYGGGTLPQGF
ncbi:hypothetical protein SAMN05428997_11113 [Bosea sp. CRIB-10]|uniref:Argininosuccinate lyase n=1 Tax=Bosea eneae TaxID=151454 RepID=A0ABW0IRI0_9HYPH|nr:hypothetical protein [Bosea sp. CRIB-10]PZR83504.1 MAG: hypothetical protein DI537_34795 [Stutzerimonas stutzeri]SFC75327.1 hypothetical protein SAMN05428997_11113 [Bosea sp. CRIB-10]